MGTLIMNTLQCVERSTGSKSCRNREQGSLSAELVIAIPIVVLITLFVVQGFLAASVISSTQAAARDGARAAMTHQMSVDNAVAEALPDWVVIDHVSRNCTGENCVAVTTRVPIGIPWITSSELTVTRSASFPRGDS
jgi:TadE-like protein.